MEEWKLRQDLYHKLTEQFDDDLNDKEIAISSNVIEDAIEYFYSRDIGWIYPSKSYMVGICYAKWLAETFGGRPLEYLDDQALLYDNDPYFVKYSSDPRTYLQILEKIGGWNFDQTQGMVPDVKGYFIKEFMIEDYPLETTDK